MEANILTSITQQQVTYAVLAGLAVAMIASAWNYHQHRNTPKAIGLGAHITVWQASSACNFLFWYILGSSMDAISALLLPVTFFVGDIAKAIIPLTSGYKRSYYKQAAVWFIRAASIFATVSLGIMYFQQNTNAAQDANLAQQEATMRLEAAKTGQQAAQAAGQSQAPDLDRLAKIEQLQATLQQLKDQPAQDSRGKTLRWQGKKSPATTVWVATKGCSDKSAYTKVPANDCQTIIQTLDNLDNLQQNLVNQAENLSNQQQGTIAAADQIAAARQVLQDTPPALPVNAMIANIRATLGQDPQQANDQASNSMIFGLFLGFALEILVMATIGLDFTPHKPAPEDDQPSIVSQAASWARARLPAVFSTQNSAESRDNHGSNAGQMLDNSTQKLSSDPISAFRAVTTGTLPLYLDINAADNQIEVKDGHSTVLALLMQRYAENVSTCRFYDDIKAEHGEGVRKAYIDEAKLILHRNGYMTAKPWGNTGTKYEWVDETTLISVIRQHQTGTWRYTKPARETAGNVFQLPLKAA